jgi:hypothetical protein
MIRFNELWTFVKAVRLTLTCAIPEPIRPPPITVTCLIALLVDMFLVNIRKLAAMTL